MKRGACTIESVESAGARMKHHELLYRLPPFGTGQWLSRNSYWLVQQGSGIVINPSPHIPLSDQMKNAQAKRLDFVVIQHPDSAAIQAVNLWEQAGVSFTIVTHWRTALALEAQGSVSPRYLVNEHQYRLSSPQGTKLEFIPSAYLPSPASFMTYDAERGLLFSPHLFSSFSPQTPDVLDCGIAERLDAFHEHFIPSNRIMQPILDFVKTLQPSIIYPEFGEPLRDQLSDRVDQLYRLECGSYLYPLKQDLVKQGGYQPMFERLMRRHSAFFGWPVTRDVWQELPILLAEDEPKIYDLFASGETIWQQLFATIYASKGFDWLMVIKPLVLKLVYQYDLKVPEVFYESTGKGEIYKNERRLYEVQQEALLNQTQESLLRFQDTGAYNAAFLSHYFQQLLPTDRSYFLVVQVTPHPASRRYEEVQRQIYQTSLYVLRNALANTFPVFVIRPGFMIIHLFQITEEARAEEQAEIVRNALRSENVFLEAPHFSIAVIGSEEMKKRTDIPTQDAFTKLAMERLEIGLKSGQTRVVGSKGVRPLVANRVVLCDPDGVTRDVLTARFKEAGMEVWVAKDGQEVVTLAQTQRPAVILCEIMLPKLDAFRIREQLRMHSDTDQIPLVLISYLKDESNVLRALSLGIRHYYKKPFLLAELVGIVRLLAQAGERA
jgi:CheY-like chemotaxis protein